ncbi:ATP-binding protein [Nocardioides sp. zg-1230]|uniref:ATP-binding protein n=1 Tax=Nocardioides sp. zg-1230 TaxID=2736601 RepID=UPI001551EAA6|nr:ATP-binding protein [Nocardioides sp. zg-1230]NPC44574.1 ATP-binding protein [Nocardioides sp. zg-1230]
MSRRAPDWTRRASFDADPVSASLARSFVVDQLVHDELAHLVDPVRLVTSELATNAILHARTRFTVTLERTEDLVVLTVGDHSPRTPVRRATGPTGYSGRGLDIVARTSLDWGVDASRDASKQVWASFSVDGHAPP